MRSGPLLGAPAPAAISVDCGDADLSASKSLVYVQPSGVDGPSCGTSTATACKTIQHGIDRCGGAGGAGGAGCAVLLRHGLYETDATIVLKDGVDVHGSCLFDGEPDRRYRTMIHASPAAGMPAISANAIDSPTTVHGVVVIGADRVAGGGANVAMAVNSSKGLTLKRSMLASGRGGDGLPGSAGGAPGAGARGAGGNNVSSAAGASGGQACPASPPPPPTGMGGQGGDGLQGYVTVCFIVCTCVYANSDASLGRAGQPSGSTRGGAKGSKTGGKGDWCSFPDAYEDFPGPGGSPGSTGACSSSAGLPSGKVWGALAATGWQAGLGGTGNPGDVGSGGAGGTSGGFCVGFPDGFHSEMVQGVPGGGGGGGGCGGSGGIGGPQGGASIALSLYDSSVGFVAGDVVLAAGAGGQGGRGGPGTAGGPGGPGGAGSLGQFTSVRRYQCPGAAGAGGPGGQGGAGAGGGGGNGGPSIGIALRANSKVPAGAAGVHSGRAGEGGSGGNGGINPACTAVGGLQGAQGGSAAVVDFDRAIDSMLLPGQQLTKGQSITSPDGQVRLAMQTDGNFCLYPPGAAPWCSRQNGMGDGNSVVMQTDGNLCLYPTLGSQSCTTTEGHPGAWLVVQDSGHVQVTDGQSTLWTRP